MGTFSAVPGLTSQAECQPCPAGFYCGEAGLTAPTGPCHRGQFLYHNTNDSVLFMSFFSYHNVVVGIWIGYWCPPGQTVDAALPCPSGHFCLQASAAPEPCPPGTYQDREKQADCAVCVAGSDCYIVYRFFCLATAWKFEM